MESLINQVIEVHADVTAAVRGWPHTG